MDNEKMDAWIRDLIAAEHDSLVFSVTSCREMIIHCTPMGGEFGDEFDRAKDALAALLRHLQPLR